MELLCNTCFIYSEVTKYFTDQVKSLYSNSRLSKTECTLEVLVIIQSFVLLSVLVALVAVLYTQGWYTLAFT